MKIAVEMLGNFSPSSLSTARATSTTGVARWWWYSSINSVRWFKQEEHSTSGRQHLFREATWRQFSISRSISLVALSTANCHFHTELNRQPSNSSRTRSCGGGKVHTISISSDKLINSNWNAWTIARGPMSSRLLIPVEFPPLTRTKKFSK